jgi:hypothetical protein
MILSPRGDMKDYEPSPLRGEVIIAIVGAALCGRPEGQGKRETQERETSPRDHR